MLLDRNFYGGVTMPRDVVTVSFTCHTNKALLLMALHDILTLDHLDDSIVALDSFAWLVDEIGQMAAQSLALLEENPARVSNPLRKLAALYEEHAK